MTRHQTTKPGARWVRAALQVNPYGYDGRGAPSQNFTDEASYNVALLDACEAEGVELLAVTDHWCVETARQLVGDATARGLVALPGFEANSSEGVHLLVIFDAETDFAQINAAIGLCGGTPGCANGTTGKSYESILAEMDARGALVIPAHVNVANGGMLTGRAGPPLVKMVKNPGLHAIAVSPNQPDASEQEAICNGRKPFDREHPLSVIYADDVSQPDTLSARGAITWFKMSVPGLESLKLAVRTPTTRVSLENPTYMSRALISDISWTGGFLDGVTLPISPDLTALIGGRGTGKSAVIESIRYALGLSAIGDDAKRDHESIVQRVLRSGTTVRVSVHTVTPSVRQFIIERSVPNPPIVRDSSGSVTRLAVSDVVGMVEIFGQHELAELAQDQAGVARMLERFAEVTGPDAEYHELRDLLRENRTKLQRAEKSRDELEEELADIPRLEDHVAHYKATDLPTRLAELEQLDRDEAVLTEGTAKVASVRRASQALSVVEVTGPLAIPIDDAETSPAREILTRVNSVTTKLAADVETIRESLASALTSADGKIAQVRRDWAAATDPQRAGHAEVLRNLVEDGHDPDKYLSTTKALASLKSKAGGRGTIASSIRRLAAERQELLGRLAANETQQSEALNDAVRQANSATRGVVAVRPVAAPDRQHIKAVLEKRVKGQRTQIMAAVDSEVFSTRTFVAAVRSGLGDLEEQFGIRGAQARSLVESGEGVLRELEELVVGQAVDVQLNITAGTATNEYRSLDQLSKGQRATALLILLLGASTAPLVIDQPEDDLDNRFVYTGVVQKLRDLKGARQTSPARTMQTFQC